MSGSDSAAAPGRIEGGPVLLSVEGLCKYFPLPRGLIGMLTNRSAGAVHAIDGISFELRRGEILALVGESGCGKTTTALTLMGLLEADEGTIRFNGEDVTHLGTRGQTPRATIAALERQSFRREPSFQPTLTIKGLRRQMQMVFQDPYESLNPRATVFETVAEPLEVHGLARTREGLLPRVRQALEEAGLSPAEDYLWRRPHELSGGQRQRVVIAGALVLEPILLIADEPVSMLDVSIRAEILNLLDALRTQRGISVLCITHDLGTAAYFTDRIAVMYLGRIVESGPTRDVLGAAAAPIHAGAALGDPRSQSAPAAQTHDPHRRDPQPRESPQRLPLPPALPDRHRALQAGRSDAASSGTHARCGVPVGRSARRARLTTAVVSSVSFARLRVHLIMRPRDAEMRAAGTSTRFDESDGDPPSGYEPSQALPERSSGLVSDSLVRAWTVPRLWTLPGDKVGSRSAGADRHSFGRSRTVHELRRR